VATGQSRQERILEQVRAGGGRMTAAKQAVVDALLAAGGSHVTADDLVAGVARSQPDVHRSTVYRTLETLERLGVVEHVHLGHAGGTYHLTDERHQHLVCDDCGGVEHVPEAVTAGLARSLKKRYGFTLSSHHFALTGRCRHCS